MNNARPTAVDAKRALRDIDAVQGKAGAFAFYDGAGPIIMVWGVIWLLAGGLAYFKPDAANLAWMGGIAAGAAFSAVFGWLAGRKQSPGASFPKALLAGLAAAGVLLIGLNAMGLIAGVDSRAQGNALISLAVAIAYVLMGLSRGARLAALGLVLGAATIAG